MTLLLTVAIVDRHWLKLRTLSSERRCGVPHRGPRPWQLRGPHDASRARLTQTRGALLPSISAGGLWLDRSFNLKTFGLHSPRRRGRPPLPDWVSPFSSVDGRLSATWTVFDYANVLRLRAAGAGRLDQRGGGGLPRAKARPPWRLAYVRAARGRAAVKAREDERGVGP